VLPCRPIIVLGVRWDSTTGPKLVGGSACRHLARAWPRGAARSAALFHARSADYIGNNGNGAAFWWGGGRYDESQGMTELERARERLKSIKQGNLGPRAELGSTLPLGTSDPPISYTRSSIDDESTTGAVDGAGASVVSSPSQEQVLPEPSWRPRVVSHPCVDRSFCE